MNVDMNNKLHVDISLNSYAVINKSHGSSCMYDVRD